jgi:hypothetical protein
MKESRIASTPDTVGPLEIVCIDNEEYFKISNVDRMPAFFMSIVSDSNHWMFIASNGGLTAGRTNADHALFPYYTDDKVTESNEHVGSKTIIQGNWNGKVFNWEPFSVRSQQFNTERNLFKHRLGNSIIFEEINHDLNLRYSYQWSTSDKYGFVRTSVLTNHSDHEQQLRVLDGLQSVMPADVGSDLQNTFSNLVNAYKYSELHVRSGLGIYALSARITDRAEPSEALYANTVWSTGLAESNVLLSAKQLDNFRHGLPVATERQNKGDVGTYLISSTIMLSAGQSTTWKCIANVHQSQSHVIELIDAITTNVDINTEVEHDINNGSQQLLNKVMSVDGFHASGDALIDSRHYSNSLFNAMRGGVFPSNYIIDRQDFIAYVKSCNIGVHDALYDSLSAFPVTFTLHELNTQIDGLRNTMFTRIALEYLPLTFSRRHGDPSRPWNRFSINTKNADGSLKLDYQGNWRDIFQNWEALAHSYPLFLEGMIRKFLNASTVDGFNPYRVQKHGFDWEIIEAHNPWSYIGYWGDHQIIYLLKLLELLRDTQPERMRSLLQTEGFAFACIPYRIKSYDDIVLNPKSTIDFDHELHDAITTEMRSIGADGSLVKSALGDIYHGHFVEKILTTLLARLTNYIPDGGIWMNTQRPEWNDANNALVGNGMSMVTLCYLHRFILFFKEYVDKNESLTCLISEELSEYFTSTSSVFVRYQSNVSEIDDELRRSMMDELGHIGSAYRTRVYGTSFTGKKETLSFTEIQRFFDSVLVHLRSSISKNRRPDGLYHAYNLLTLQPGKASVSCLPEMLEGQVAALSSGYVSADEATVLLDALKSGNLYRPDQDSYMLYPIKTVPGFLERNTIPNEKVKESALLMSLLASGNSDIIQRDVHGCYHFNGRLTNTREYQTALHALDRTYHEALKSEETSLLELYESVFHHKQFTGRSGTFFAYEGIGSIYWHMVSKLRYAVQEIYTKAIEDLETEETIHGLGNHYKQICDGIGVHKSPKTYGAFPTDPYSHTPLGKGAQQPGMTGQVKEDVICRMRELGVSYRNGTIRFTPSMISCEGFLQHECNIDFRNVHGEKHEISLAQGSLGFSICQTPVIYRLTDRNELTICKSDGSIETSSTLELSASDSNSVFSRDGSVQLIHVELNRFGLSS